MTYTVSSGMLNPSIPYHTTGAVTRAKLQIVSTNKRTSSFYNPDALPVAQPTVSEHWREIVVNCTKHKVVTLHCRGINFVLSALAFNIKVVTLHCRGINFVLSALAFNIIPTIFEVGLVTGVLVCPCRLVAVGTLCCSAIMNVCDCITCCVLVVNHRSNSC